MDRRVGLSLDLRAHRRCYFSYLCDGSDYNYGAASSNILRWWFFSLFLGVARLKENYIGIYRHIS